MQNLLEISFEYWEEEIKIIVSNDLGLSDGDTIALMEANQFLISQSWAKNLTAKQAADKIINE